MVQLYSPYMSSYLCLMAIYALANFVPISYPGPPLSRGDFSQNRITSSLCPKEAPMENEVDWLVKYFLSYVVNRHMGAHKLIARTPSRGLKRYRSVVSFPIFFGM